MNIQQLCDAINLQPEVKSQVSVFASDFDFSTIEKQLKDFLIYEKMKDAQIELQELLGDDKDYIKILTCMLQASVQAYAIYNEKGISDEIYFATMKCYTRFISETYAMTGRLYFDRYWWTARQAGCHLFRIGALEYEIKSLSDRIVIGIHIPSDADFSPSAVSASIEMANEFFAKHYPELANCEYRCHSWLLDKQLRCMLSENSNIVSFQNRFEIIDEGEADTEFVEWLFNSKTTDYTTLPEKTSLQRNVKKYILSGGKIRNAYGRLTLQTDRVMKCAYET